VSSFDNSVQLRSQEFGLRARQVAAQEQSVNQQAMRDMASVVGGGIQAGHGMALQSGELAMRMQESRMRNRLAAQELQQNDYKFYVMQQMDQLRFAQQDYEMRNIAKLKAESDYREQYGDKASDQTRAYRQEITTRLGAGFTTGPGGDLEPREFKSEEERKQWEEASRMGGRFNAEGRYQDAEDRRQRDHQIKMLEKAAEMATDPDEIRAIEEEILNTIRPGRGGRGAARKEPQIDPEQQKMRDQARRMFSVGPSDGSPFPSMLDAPPKSDEVADWVYANKAGILKKLQNDAVEGRAGALPKNEDEAARMAIQALANPNDPWFGPFLNLFQMAGILTPEDAAYYQGRFNQR
jgi:hypothetical protein